MTASIFLEPMDILRGVELPQQLVEPSVDLRRDMRAVGSKGIPCAEHDQPVLNPHFGHLTHQCAHSLFDGVPSFLVGAIEHLLREHNPNAEVGA